MVKRVVYLAVAVGLVGMGIWLSRELGTVQIWLFGMGLAGLVGISAEGFLERSTIHQTDNHRQLFGLWIAPTLLVAAGLWLAQSMPLDALVGVAGSMAGLMAVLLLGLRAGMNPAGHFSRPGRFAVNLVLYLLVFLLLALIYHTRERSLITAAFVGAVSLVAALELLRTSDGIQPPTWRFAGLAAMVMAETTWGLNYWPMEGLVGSAMLLLTFYVLVGLLTAIRDGRMDRRMLAEYCTVGAVGLATIIWAMP